MASVATPIQLTLLSQMLQNLGLKSLPATLTTAVTGFNSTPLIAAFVTGMANVLSLGNRTLYNTARSIGNSTVPALGNSIPTASPGPYTYLNNYYLATTEPLNNSAGISNFVVDLGNAYLGNGDAAKFSLGFCSVFSYKETVNKFITTSVNVNNYLGPTYKDADAISTANISQVNSVFDRFGLDIQRQGKLVDTTNLDLYGTPAGLLQQISKVAGLGNRTLPAIQEIFQVVGLTEQNIQDLVSNNRVSVERPNGLTDNEFDKLQKLAYLGLTLLSDNDLAQVLDILDITTPNITSGDQLLDPKDMFPTSYLTLTTPSPTGPLFVYTPDGSVNQLIAPIVNSYLPTATGCDELGKIIPPATAVANKAIQVALQNVDGIANTSWPAFGEAIYGNSPDQWNSTQDYLPNSVVAVVTSSADPTTGVPINSVRNYQSQQYVPAGTSITDTNYWKPSALGNLQTMIDLPLIQSTSAPVPASVTQYFDNTVATGSGAYGTITMTDIIGTAVDYNNLAAAFSAATTAVTGIAGAGVPEYTSLLNAYIALQTATLGTAPTEIANANTAISNLVANYPAPHPIAGYIATLNQVWPTIAQAVNAELKYQTEAGFNYFELTNVGNVNTYSFLNLISQFAQDQVPGGAWDVLTEIFDTTTLGGQAGVAALREAYNLQRLDAVGIRTDATQVPVGAVPGGDFVTPPADPALFENFPANRLEL